MFLAKLKRVMFASLSLSVVLLVLWASFYTGWLIKPGVGVFWSIILKLLLSILCVGAMGLMLLLMSIPFNDSKNVPFLLGSLYLNSSKWIYHSELGYFLIIFDSNNKITVYKQSIFYMREEAEVDISNVSNDDVSEYVSGVIKIKLDEVYQKKLKKINAYKESKSRIDHLKKWDGYLNVVDRRDGKIRDLLK